MRLLTGTGAFGLVAFGTTADRDRAGADRAVVASARPTGRFKMEDDGSPDRTKRTVEWQLTIKVEAMTPDPQDAYADLDRLVAVAHNTLENQSYGGFTIAWKSTLGQGRIDDSRFPELRYSAVGTFAYIVDDTTGGLSVSA